MATQYSAEFKLEAVIGTHQGAVQEMHLQAYLDEYVFRFNRRKSANRGVLFYRLLESAMHVPPTAQSGYFGNAWLDGTGTPV